MAVLSLTNAFMFVDGHDFTCDINELNVVPSVEVKNTSTMCNEWDTVIAGKKTVAVDFGGFWQAGADQVDPDVFTLLGGPNAVMSAGPAATETGTCYILQARHFQYTMFGDYGEPAPFSVNSAGASRFGVIRGQLAVSNQTVTGTGAVGSGCQLGAVAADEFLYATFHVFSPGTTITAVIESDDNPSFTSATTRATIGPITTKSGTWATRVAGAITDDYYRVRVTAITGSFDIAAAVGIG